MSYKLLTEAKVMRFMPFNLHKSVSEAACLYMSVFHLNIPETSMERRGFERMLGEGRFLSSLVT